MENGPTAVSEFKNGIGHRVELENRYRYRLTVVALMRHRSDSTVGGIQDRKPVAGRLD
jgi:hypothetical protein